MTAIGAILAGLVPARPGSASVTALAGPARPSAGTAGSRHGGNPLSGVRAYLSTRKGVVQVAVFDKRTGRTNVLSTGRATQYTASVVKVDILAMWLRRYQHRPGTIPASIPYSIRYLMTPMITMSDNVAATSLFYFGGG